jgi:hypothetical protein
VSEWQINQYRMVHPVHDTFFIGVSYVSGSADYRVTRVYEDPTQENGLGHEFIPTVAEGEYPTDFATLEEAKAAVAKRIRELDAAATSSVREGL